MVRHAGLTERDFECEFASAEDCYLAAFDHGLALAARSVISAASAEESWRARARTGMHALLSFFDHEPGWARLLLVAPPAFGQRALARRQRALESLTRLLHRESPNERTEDNFALSRELVAELVVGGVFSVVHSRVIQGEGRALRDLTPSLMAMIVLQYLGPAAASAELTTPAGPAHAGAAQAASAHDPGASPATPAQKTRTTWRTMLVLRAIAASPHSSNRDVAAVAGLTDEGQTSKLLQRLQRQGLVENLGLGQAHGEPNAWLLTAEGQRLVEVIGSRFADGPRAEGSERRVRRTGCQS